MTTLGQESDTKIPELISAIGGVPSLLASAKKTLEESKVLEEQSSNLPQAGEEVLAIGNDLLTFLKNKSNISILTKSQIASL